MESIMQNSANEQEKNGSQASNNDAVRQYFFDLNDFEPPKETPEQLRERLIASGFPLNYIERSPAEYLVDDDNREALAEAKEFVSSPNDKKGLYICGGFGTGKTWLAVLIGRRMAECGKWVAFGTFSEITNKLQRALSSQSGDYSNLWKYYTQNAQLLIIDDLGKEKPSEWKLQVLFDIMDERERAKLLTVFTSNYSLADLCERITPANGDNITAGAIRSRLGGKNSPERYLPLVLAGEDRR